MSMKSLLAEAVPGWLAGWLAKDGKAYYIRDSGL